MGADGDPSLPGMACEAHPQAPHRRLRVTPVPAHEPASGLPDSGPLNGAPSTERLMMTPPDEQVEFSLPVLLEGVEQNVRALCMSGAKPAAICIIAGTACASARLRDRDYLGNVIASCFPSPTDLGFTRDQHL